jgi:hypothetical protein
MIGEATEGKKHLFSDARCPIAADLQIERIRDNTSGSLYRCGRQFNLFKFRTHGALLSGGAQLGIDKIRGANWR